MNPKSWVENICVGEVDIQAEYLAGRNMANDMLVAYFQGKAINFDQLFSRHDVDHLRPKKEYIGSKTVDGEVLVEEDELPITGRLPTSTSMETQDNEFEDTRNAIDLNDYNGTDVDLEDLSSSEDHPIDKDILDPLQIYSPSKYELENNSNLPSTTTTTPRKKSDTLYLTVNGERRYIPTLIGRILGEDREETKIETSRLSRVQGIARERALNSSGDQLDANEGKARSGDLGVVLTHVGNQICLAVVEALNFRQGSSNTNHAAVDVDDLDADGTKATSVAIQFLQLVSQGPESDDSNLTWWWPEQYILIQDNGDGPILLRHIATRISGKIFHLISPNIIYNSIGHPIW